MSAPERPRALIVGAGIGGLAAALALERAGLRVLIFERAPELRELGFALLLAPNAMRALRMLEVADQVVAQAEVAQEGELRGAHGRVFQRTNLAAIRRATGEHTVCAQRHVLHNALLQALRGVEPRVNAAAVGFEQTADGVTLQLAGGERVRGELLIGADGIASTLRAQLHADPLRPSGLVAYRGVCRASFPLTGAQYFGRGIEAGVGRAGGGAVYWYVSAKHDPTRDTRPAKSAALELTRNFDRALIDLVEHTEAHELRGDLLCDRAPLQRWGTQRVTLLGDAAHPMLPHAGQGAAQALEDAVVLGRCLAATSDIRAALLRYERLRLPRTTRIVRLARRNARIGSLDGRLSCALRDWLLQHGPAALLEKQLVALTKVELAV